MNNCLCRALCLAALTFLAAPFSSHAQSVVVNKYYNSGGTTDIVEFLVIGTNAVGSTVDMQGMILKDTSSNMAGDSGGKSMFNTNALWANQVAGTLIVVYMNSTNTLDTNTAWVVKVGSLNSNYFTTLQSGLDVATTDMLMIKTAGSGTNGTTGMIHALAGGTAGAQYTGAPTPKLIAPNTSPSARYVYATNPNATLADFDGTNAIGNATGLTFGTANTSGNQAYLNFLRGSVTPSLVLTLASPSVLESNSAGVTATLYIPTPLSSNLPVTVSASPTGVVTFSTNVVEIPAGFTNASFTVFPVLNPSYSDLSATVTASNGAYLGASAIISVLNTDVPSTTVLVNKFFNSTLSGGTDDAVELLVVGTNAPGSTANLQGCIVKDYSSSIGGDSGGKYLLQTNALWSSVPAGTLIVLSQNANDLDTNTPWVIRVGLQNSNFVTQLASGFDIANGEMISIKAAGSGALGSGGSIHSLAGATNPGSVYAAALPPKLLGTGTSSGGQLVYATNPFGLLSDFDGTNAVAGVTPAGSGISLGLPSTASNSAYISYLRGAPIGDGTGYASITNATTGLFLDTRIFPRNTNAITARLEVSGAIFVTGNLATVTITVPPEFGTPVLANVALGGAGFASASLGVTGSNITITGATVTSATPGTVTISNLVTPSQASPTAPVNYPFVVSTALSGGTLTGIASQPRALVSTPVENIRDVNVNGVPIDLGAQVAIEGTGTVPAPGFNSGRLETFIQNNGYGVNIFDQTLGYVFLNPITNGGTYIVAGTVVQFQGLTEVMPTALGDIIEIAGPAAPAPQSVLPATLFANPERYEGALVTVQALLRTDTNAWGQTNLTYTFKDAISANTLTMRLSSAQSTEFIADPGTNTLVDITGILSQSDTTTPFTGNYVLLPLYVASFPAAAPNYNTWAYGFALSGTRALEGSDADNDGVANLLEYAFGNSPTNPASRALPVNTNVGGFLTIYVPRSTNAPDLTYVVEGGVDLLVWQTNSTFGAGDGSTVEVPSTNAVSTTPTDFLRVKVTKP